MKNREEMLKDLHRRMDEYESDRKMKRAKIIKVAASVTPVCVAAVVGVGLWKGGALTPRNDQLISSTDESTTSDMILSADNDTSAGRHSENDMNTTYTKDEPAASKPAKDQNTAPEDAAVPDAAENDKNMTDDGRAENTSNVSGNSKTEDKDIHSVTDTAVEHADPSVPKTTTPIHNDSGHQVIWAENNNAVIEFYEGFTQWHQFDSVSCRLYEVLESGDDDDVFAILARPVVEYTFLYNGKTLAEYYSDMCNERNLPEILGQLLKEGDSLKYGEALYKTGTPFGEKWAQSLYEERIAYYGETILGKYIVNGEFLSEKVEQDISSAMNNNDATVAYKTAYGAYLNQIASTVKGKLPAEGVVEENGIIMYLTKDEFSVFTADRIEAWTFDLAYKGDGMTHQYGVIEDE